MTNPEPSPEIIDKIGFAAFSSFAMVAGMQLELFTPLGNGPMRAEQLAEALGVGAAKLNPLLYALVSTGLLTVEDGWFANTPEADYYLVKGKPTYQGSRHAWFTGRYLEALQTAESVRSGLPKAKINFRSMSPEDWATAIRGFHPAALASGRDLANRYDFSSRRHLIDVGGGSGGVSIAIAKAYPHLRATVFDLPSATPTTQRFIEQEGMVEQVNVIAGDVLQEPLTGSYDVAVLRALIQVLSPEDAQRVLNNLNVVLEPGSPIYIIGQILDDSRLSPPEAVASNMFFINIYDAGQAYPEQDYRDWLTGAGFVEIERFPLAGARSLIAARKPS